MKRFILLLLVLVLLIACSSHHVVRIENEQKGKLTSIYDLRISDSLQFRLDTETAPKSEYIQLYQDGSNVYLTLLNAYNNSIYIYDYKNNNFLERISFEKEGSDGILGIEGYYIKNMDSIYIYNKLLMEIVLADSAGSVKEHIPLGIRVQSDWTNHYPQFDFSTVCPLFEKSGKLIISGFTPFSIEKSFLENFRYTAYMDMNSKQVEFYHVYPMDLYGDVNWDDPFFMQIFYAISPDNKMVHSFPISHNLYINEFGSDAVATVYGGCNVASTISSIDWDLTKSQKIPTESLLIHYLEQDLYGAILYDSWRKVYYRFMQKGILNATTKNAINEKQIILILFDDKFNYLGEKNIGNGVNWYIPNAFVTEKGLNIQYIDQSDMEEEYLKFKIFTMSKI